MTARPGPCPNPPLQEAILSRLRSEQPLGVEAMAHIEDCADCRTAAERLRRIRASWQAQAPDAQQLARMRARFEAGQRARNPRWVWGAAAAAMLMTAFAAAQSGLLPAWVDELTETQAPAPTSAPAPVPTFPEQDDSVEPEPAPEFPGPQTQSAPEADQSPLPVASVQHGSWQKVARAMRDGAYARAEGALAELARSPEARVRQAAELTLAQLWLRQGRVEQARPVLERLAKGGATDLLRERAAELLYAKP